MFNFWKANKKFKLPEIYKRLITKDEYNHILTFCREYLDNKNQEIIKIEDGLIIAKIGEDENKYYLDNLVRLLSQREKKDWKQLVFDHLDKTQIIPGAVDYLLKDFEYACQFIKAYIKSDTIFQATELDDYVNKIDLPETRTFLILDFHEQFHYVRRDSLAEWNKSEEELFEIGFANISLESIEIKEKLFEDTYTLYTFFDGDFSSTFIIELAKNGNFAIGSFGSLVAVPTKGSAFVHPIENAEVIDLITVLYPTIEKFYLEDPGNINTNFYWYYDGSFELFPSVQEGELLTINYPEGLKTLLAIE